MTFDTITSLHNERVKNLVRLQKSSERKKQNRILIEGWREIAQALRQGFVIDSVFLNEDKSTPENLRRIEQWKINPVVLTSAVFEKAAYRENTEGIIATAIPIFKTLENLDLKSNPLIIVLESVEKPGNLGAVLRTIEAAAGDALIVCDPLTDIYNPNVIRSSIGCVFSVPVVACSSTEAINFLKKNDIKTFAAALTASKRYDRVDFRTPTAIVLGTEATGLSDAWISAADERIIIPMLGSHDSLNVSVTAAILIFEAKRQRGFD